MPFNALLLLLLLFLLTAGDSDGISVSGDHVVMHTIQTMTKSVGTDADTDILLRSQLHFWVSPFLVRFLRMRPFLNPTTEVVTFHLSACLSDAVSCYVSLFVFLPTSLTLSVSLSVCLSFSFCL